MQKRCLSSTSFNALRMINMRSYKELKKPRKYMKNGFSKRMRKCRNWNYRRLMRRDKRRLRMRKSGRSHIRILLCEWRGNRTRRGRKNKRNWRNKKRRKLGSQFKSRRMWEKSMKVKLRLRNGRGERWNRWERRGGRKGFVKECRPCRKIIGHSLSKMNSGNREIGLLRGFIQSLLIRHLYL